MYPCGRSSFIQVTTYFLRYMAWFHFIIIFLVSGLLIFAFLHTKMPSDVSISDDKRTYLELRPWRQKRFRMTKERMTNNLPPGWPLELKFGTEHRMIILNNTAILFFRLQLNISDRFRFYVFRDYLEMAKNEIRSFVIRRQKTLIPEIY